MAFRCGKCHACLVQRGRLWKHRLMLEAACHVQSSFVTLTYSEKNIPNLWLPVSSTSSEMVLRGTLVAGHLSAFLKRVRKRVGGRGLRFFGVGEYGEKTWRPHYHVILFGFPSCRRGRTRRHFATNRVMAGECCDRCRAILDLWGMGDIEMGSVTAESMGYISGYVLKRLTDTKDMRLRGRNPEFARMSNRPGIGAQYMYAVKRILDDVGVGRDVPASLMHGSSSFPLNRYLRNRLRVLCGRPEGCPDEILWEMAQEMRALREGHAVSTFEEWKTLAIDTVSSGVGEVKARSAIFKGRRVL